MRIMVGKRVDGGTHIILVPNRSTGKKPRELDVWAGADLVAAVGAAVRELRPDPPAEAPETP